MASVLVIGMHRSGTSMITHLLTSAGAYLGPSEDMLSADISNSAGYWEHVGFKELNDDLLAALGGSWYDPPRFAPSCLEAPDILTIRAGARKMLAEQFEPHALWAVKDPRATLALPFWQSVISKPRYVVCVRNPLDVAGSLNKRDHITIGFGSALWHIYTFDALRNTAATDRLILQYEDVLLNPRKAAEKLFPFLDSAQRLSDPAVLASIDALVDSGLRHHEHTLQDLLDHPQVLPATKRLYQALASNDAHALEKSFEDYTDSEEMLYTITQTCGALYREIIEPFEQAKSDLGAASAALQNKSDILNSRTHRWASRINKWMIALRGGPNA